MSGRTIDLRLHGLRLCRRHTSPRSTRASHLLRSRTRHAGYLFNGPLPDGSERREKTNHILWRPLEISWFSFLPFVGSKNQATGGIECGRIDLRQRRKVLVCRVAVHREKSADVSLLQRKQARRVCGVQRAGSMLHLLKVTADDHVHELDPVSQPLFSALPGGWSSKDGLLGSGSRWSVGRPG